MEKVKLNTIEEAIEDFKAGKLRAILLCDFTFRAVKMLVSLGISSYNCT